MTRRYWNECSVLGHRLWAAWAIFAFMAILGMVFGSRPVGLGFAVAAALFGWAEFFTHD
jgi:hypothetical protein